MFCEEIVRRPLDRPSGKQNLVCRKSSTLYLCLGRVGSTVIVSRFLQSEIYLLFKRAVELLFYLMFKDWVPVTQYSPHPRGPPTGPVDGTGTWGDVRRVFPHWYGSRGENRGDLPLTLTHGPLRLHGNDTKSFIISKHKLSFIETYKSSLVTSWLN